MTPAYSWSKPLTSVGIVVELGTSNHLRTSQLVYNVPDYLYTKKQKKARSGAVRTRSWR